MDALYKDGILLHLDVSFWRGRKSLAAQDVGLQSQDIPDIVSLGSKGVVPKKEIAKFQALYMRAYLGLNSQAFPFPIGNLWYVPNGTKDDVFAMLQEIYEEWLQTKEDFLQRYGDLVAEILDAYPQLFLSKPAPGVDSVRNRFTFRWTLLKVSPSQDGEENYKSQINEFLDQAFQSLRTGILETLAEVSEKIQSGKVNSRSLNLVRSAVGRFKALDFFQDTETTRKLDEFLSILPNDPRLTDQVLPVLQNMRRVVLDQSEAPLREYKRKVNWQ